MLIIDAGPAVTIDYVGTDRIFRGGVIVPGLHAMFNSLNLSTAQIRAYTGRETGCDLGLQNPDTRGAVENGVRLALASAVDNAIEQHTESASGDLRVFVAGGDAAWIQGNCRHHMEVAPELVLEGINFLAAETTDGGITP